MLKSYKYKLLPTKQQAILIDSHVGANRFIYNLALEVRKIAWDTAHIKLSYYDINKQLPSLKEECPWLKELNSQALQTPIRNLDVAFSKFFKEGVGFPKFKKKTKSGSFNIPQKVSLKGGRLNIPKFKGGIKVILHRPIQGQTRQATISRTSTGKYFVSILCETGEARRPKVEVKEATTVGIDLGIKTYLVTSEGVEVENPKFLRKMQSKLKFTQRKYSKHKGRRTGKHLALLHEKVANQRKNFLHKISSELIKSHDSIAIEDLSVTNMIKNHKLALSIADASWGMFVEMLKYKADWYGKNILQIGRFSPSSKTCSCCGYVNKELTLKNREWPCPKCYKILDRDVNAAINIKSFALSAICLGSLDLKIRTNCLH